MPANKGSMHHNSKMTDEKVRVARRYHTDGDNDGKVWNISELARSFGITHQSMRAILMGDTWKHVDS